MITNFKLFGVEHIISIIIPIILGIIFIFLSKKYPEKKKIISIILAITIIIIRSVRYVFDINIGVFELKDLISLHICNIDLYILIICLFKPNKKIFSFLFLIGIPTALSVALMPGKIHPDPGIIRAIFFIMSHMMLVMGAVYIGVTYNYEITKKNILFYYVFSLIGMIIMYIINIIAKSNYMYLISAPKGTILENFYNIFGKVFYPISIYIILIFLITLFYLISKLIYKK